MRIKDIDSALEVFEKAAIEHSLATESGDYKTANKNYPKIGKAATFLKNLGESHLVSKFLTHKIEGVRVWAAAYLLPIQERNAVKVLETVAKGHGIQSLNAETLLSEWRKGNLKL